MVKILLYVLGGLILVAGTVLFIRFRYYKNWSTFFDDLGEQILLDFVPAPIKIIIFGGLFVWAAASFVSYFTRELKAKEIAAPQQAAVSPEQLAAAAKNMPQELPQAAAVAAAMSSSDASMDASSLLPPPPPPPPPSSSELPSSDQLAEMARQLEELQKQQSQLQPPKLDPRQMQVAMPAMMEKPEAQGTPDKGAGTIPGASLAETEPEMPAALKQLLETQQPGSTLQQKRFAYTTHSGGVSPPIVSTAVDLRKLPGEQYPLVVKTKGEWFEARLLRKGSDKTYFLRPCGDIVAIAPGKIEKVIEGPVQWPLSR